MPEQVTYLVVTEHEITVPANASLEIVDKAVAQAEKRWNLVVARKDLVETRRSVYRPALEAWIEKREKGEILPTS